MEPPRRVEVCRFPGGRRLAVTLSWDDGPVEDRRLVAFLNAVGLRGTFNLNSGFLAPATPGCVGRAEVADLYAGHEVAIHTRTHPHLPRLDPSQVAAEVLADRRALEDLVGYPVRGMAYPFGTHSPAVVGLLRALGIAYARTADVADPCFPPADPLTWGVTAHVLAESADGDVGQRFLKLRADPGAGGVYAVCGHAYEFARPGDRWAEMDRRLRPLAGHADVWYCTHVELFDHEAARRRVVVAANLRSAYNPSGVPVTLDVDGRRVDVGPGATVGLTG